MAADEVLEAMGRGIAHSSDCDGDDGFRACVPEHCVCRSLARAAIRALPPGWVVAQVPGDAPYIHTGRDERTTEYANGHYDGWDACLAAVRASAVEVDHIPEVSKMVIAEPPHGQ